jgi:transposase
VSSIVALQAPLDGPARLYARHFQGSICSQKVLTALCYFRKRIGRPLIVVWDRLPAHRAKKVEEFFNAHKEDYQVEWLPPYSPELNPEEPCNGVVKQEMLNALPSSLGELQSLVRRAFRRLSYRHQVLEGFFRHVSLDVT